MVWSLERGPYVANGVPERGTLPPMTVFACVKYCLKGSKRWGISNDSVGLILGSIGEGAFLDDCLPSSIDGLVGYIRQSD